MIKEKITARIKECQKNGAAHELITLKTVYGEIELIELRSKKELPDSEIVKVFKKFRDETNECIKELKKARRDVPEASLNEILIYDNYIPESLSLTAIETCITENINSEILSAKSAGQATGIAMAYFKRNGMIVDGSDVAAVVSDLYLNRNV